MEADLQRYYQLDYRDRWCGGLTLRRLLVLIKHLPPDSALWSQQRDGMWWSTEAHLLDDIRMALVHNKKHPAKPHPARPTTKTQKKALDPVRLEASRRRRAERLRAIERGDIA